MNGQTINYENLAKEALRSVVHSVLKQVKEEGLPGEHHFYISFHTMAPGVKISNRIKAQYPKEMTIVLQHQYWDLKVEDEYFEVRLSFSNIPELLVIPYSAVKVFFDPSVPYGLQFDQTHRPEAVEDKSAFIEDHWQMQSDNGENPFSKLTMDDISHFGSNSSENEFTPNINVETDINIEDEIPNFPPEEETLERETEETSDKTDSDSADIVSLDAFRKNK
jgi:hypothetical protein